MAAELRAAAEEAVRLLEGLAAHEEGLGAEAAAELRGTIAAVRARLAKDELTVAVVGEKKAGKSTFLNAILGARVLGAAVRECTGTVTTIRQGPDYEYVAYFEDGREERFSDLCPPSWGVDEGSHGLRPATFPPRPLAGGRGDTSGGIRLGAASTEGGTKGIEEAIAGQRQVLAECEAALPPALRGPGPARGWARLSALVHRKRLAARAEAQRLLAELEALAETRRQERFDRFVALVRRLTDMAEAGGEVVALDLWVPSPVLPPGLAILDTPGANTDDERNQARAWKAIEANADGCILLSDLQQVMSRSTRDFLQAVRAVVPHVILVLTKQDRALANAEGAEEQLEEARRLGIRRFAREMAREPEDVLALSVAAEPALAAGPDSPAAATFAAEVARLFEVLRTERALMVGARAASALETCLGRIDEAQARAEAVYAERIAAMEAQRIGEPEAFKTAELAAMRPHLLEELAAAASESAHAFHVAWARLRTRWSMQVLAATDREDLQARLGMVTGDWETELALLTRETALTARMGELVDSFSSAAHEALRARYRLAQGEHVVAELPAFEGALAEADEAVGLKAGLTEAWLAFDADMLKLGVGGAAAGAALGSLVAPGLGTLVGGLVGSLASRLLTVEMLQRDCLEKLEAEMAAVEARVRERLEDVDGHTEAVLGRVAGRLDLAIRQFQAAIEALIEQEAARLAAEHERMADMVALREKLGEAQARLRRLSQAAAEHSRGLCGL